MITRRPAFLVPEPRKPVGHPPGLRRWLGTTLILIGRWLLPPPEPTVKVGQLLRFEWKGIGVLGMSTYAIISRRGGFTVGEIDFSPQWRRPRFRPDRDAVYDQQCVAEIYAALRDYTT